MVAILEVDTRVIGGGIMDGRDVVIMINDSTDEITAVVKDDGNDNL